jgi:Ca-activated chloride channel family protein
VFCLVPAISAQEAAVFRSNVRLVRLEVTVKDSNGAIATGLNKDDFEVSESGVPQQIAVFERNTSLPLSIAVLVDTSGSTYKDLAYEIESTNRFFHAVTREGNPDDAVALYSFNWQVTQHVGFTRNTARLERALHSLRGEGGTSLYDAIFLASRDLEDREGRHAMIVVTDGGDTTSSKDFDAALEAAQRAEAVLYPIVVVPIENPAGRNIGGEHALETIAARTGGRPFFPSDSASLDQAFDDILQELRTQYLLAYYPRGVPGEGNRFHPVTVKLRRPDLRAITRSGYYGESSP